MDREKVQQLIDAEEFDRLQRLYGPLAEAVRGLIDATVRTVADEHTIAAATAAVESVTASLQPLEAEGRHFLRHADTGRPLLFSNPAVGQRNPIAPPLIVHHEPDGRVWSDFALGVSYEGPPGTAHGGVAALILDQMLGEAATLGLIEPRFTGTITVRYLRGTPLGPLRVEAWIDRIEDHKTYARGVISDADGPTAEADGVFIKPAWARESSQ